jgi:hypothetical protein
MGLFKKMNKPEHGKKIVSRIKIVLLKTQHQFADYLNRKTQDWDKASKITMLLTICLVYGIANLWLLIRALH